MFSSFYRLDLHDKTRFALANLYDETSAKIGSPII